MSKRKVEIYKIIRDKWQYLLEEPARELIHDIAKEACRQALELATENAKLRHNFYRKDEDYEQYCEYAGTYPERHDKYGEPYGVDVFDVNRQSILDIINQVE